VHNAKLVRTSIAFSRQPRHNVKAGRIGMLHGNFDARRETIMTEPQAPTASAFRAISAIDYTVVLVRDMGAMRCFYEEILGFPLLRELSSTWLEYRLGSNTLALAKPDRLSGDAPIPPGSATLQLAFRMSAAEVDQCADELVRRGVALLEPPTDQPSSHRTLFFRDPDGNLLEVYAET
jgi:catechol 2,3-dioxygenase-like lactoylglutathione lyase family enzyme